MNETTGFEDTQLIPPRNEAVRVAPYMVWCPENTDGHTWKVSRVDGRVTQVCRWCGIERASRRVRT